MLTPEELQSLGDGAVAAVRAYESELLEMMAAELAKVDLGDVVARNISQVTVRRKAQQIAKKHEPRIYKAIEADLRAAFTTNEQRDVEDAEAAETGN